MGERRFVTGAALLAVLLGAAGCAGTARVGGADDRTGGVSVHLLERLADGAAALYVVDADGTIRFGGGFDAIIDRTTWSDAMSDDEIERLRELIAALGPPATEPAPSGDAPATTRELDLRRPGGRVTIVDAGDRPDVAAIREHLDRIARRRHAAILESLPKAGAQR